MAVWKWKNNRFNQFHEKSIRQPIYYDGDLCSCRLFYFFFPGAEVSSQILSLKIWSSDQPLFQGLTGGAEVDTAAHVTRFFYFAFADMTG
jgi:hypothetical protein